jgi:hypothetical protein
MLAGLFSIDAFQPVFFSLEKGKTFYQVLDHLFQIVKFVQPNHKK